MAPSSQPPQSLCSTTDTWIFAIFTFFTFFTFFTCSHFLHYVDLQSRLVRMKIGGVNLSIFCPLLWKNPPMEPACCDDFEFREKFDTLRFFHQIPSSDCHKKRFFPLNAFFNHKKLSMSDRVDDAMRIVMNVRETLQHLTHNVPEDVGRGLACFLLHYPISYIPFQACSSIFIK